MCLLKSVHHVSEHLSTMCPVHTPPPGEGIVFDGVGGRVLNGMYTVHEAGFVNYKIALSDLS